MTMSIETTQKMNPILSNTLHKLLIHFRCKDFTKVSNNFLPLWNISIFFQQDAFMAIIPKKWLFYVLFLLIHTYVTISCTDAIDL